MNTISKIIFMTILTFIAVNFSEVNAISKSSVTHNVNVKKLELADPINIATGKLKDIIILSSPDQHL